jgi:uncharacterized protein (DUF1800 family)
MSNRHHIASIRFGYGLRLGEDAPADPVAWLERQIASPAAPPTGVGTAEAIRTRAETIGQNRAAPPQGQAMMAAPARSPLQTLVQAESRAWAAHRLASAEPFRDRLVDFWANHFTVSRRSGVVGALAGVLEREAIRPHVTGRFADMLVAVTRHPAMLGYLDNHQSVGPDSAFGRRSGRGLNENLAREVLELHTLSPAGGYTQGDVQQLAMILTGWGIAFEAEPFGFVWRPQNHQPGPKSILGRSFPEGPESQEAALRFLAAHPATHRHLAVKLARHFVADTPPPAAIRRLEAALRDSGGDLAAVSRALIALPEAWPTAPAKFRAPKDLVLAAARAVGLERSELVVSGMAALGQPLWTAPQPNGWSDRAEEWMAPEALMRRLDWAYTFAGRAGRLDPRAVAEVALGPLARAETVGAMRGAGSVRDALTLLFLSPEFGHR